MIKNIQIPGPIPQEMQVNTCCYTKVPENDILARVAKLYAEAFENFPWNEFQVCENKHYVGRKEWEATRAANCNRPDCRKPLKIAYPENEVTAYMTEELTQEKPILLTFETDNRKIFGAAWGYICSSEKLQKKYDLPVMKEKVADIMKQFEENGQKVFYLSEAMVHPSAQGQGLGKELTKSLYQKIMERGEKFLARTHQESPMYSILNQLGLKVLIPAGEDLENEGRVLFST